MLLQDAQPGQVVRNARNGHFYRFVKREGRRVRIRPLEVFPNSLLQEKTTDTIVEPDLAVHLVGDWHADMYVQVKTGKSRITYEREYEKESSRLVDLEAEALVIDPKERGSHANKVKSCKARVVVLKRGLIEMPSEAAFQAIGKDAIQACAHKAGDVVILPSGRVAKVKAIHNGSVLPAMAQIALRHRGERRTMRLPAHTLVASTHVHTVLD